MNKDRLHGFQFIFNDVKKGKFHFPALGNSFLRNWYYIKIRVNAYIFL